MQGSEQTPKAPLGNNARPLQPLHHRTIRTNIDFNSKVKYLDVHSFGGGSFIYPFYHLQNQPQQQNCPSSMYKEMYYKANKWTADLLTAGRGREFDSVFQSYKNH